MANKNHTKDEQFIMCLYENAKQSGDLESVFNRYDIGGQINMQLRGVNATSRLLVQANFIKKDGEEGIYLTPHGIKLAERLFSEL